MESGLSECPAFFSPAKGLQKQCSSLFMSRPSHSASCIFPPSVPHPQHPDRLPIFFAAQLGSVQGLFWGRALLQGPIHTCRARSLSEAALSEHPVCSPGAQRGYKKTESARIALRFPLSHRPPEQPGEERQCHSRQEAVL